MKNINVAVEEWDAWGKREEEYKGDKEKKEKWGEFR